MKGTQKIIIVTGVGRSGTSLMMQMLEAGGLPVVIDDDPIFYEHNSYYLRIKDEDFSFLHRCQGKAIKILAPIVMFLPEKDYDYAFIRCTRNPAEQVDSYIKLLNNRGQETPDDENTKYRLTKLAEADQKNLNNYLGKVGPVLTVPFEDSIKGQCIPGISNFVYSQTGVSLSHEKMKSVIIDRPPECLPYMLENQKKSHGNL